MTPAGLFGLEKEGLTNRQEGQLKMLRFSLGVTKMDRMRNKHIRGRAQERHFGAKVIYLIDIIFFMLMMIIKIRQG